MTLTVVTTKGQIVIPAKIRRRMHIKTGTRLFMEERGDELVMKPVSEEYFGKLAGTLDTKGRLAKTLLTERKKDAGRGA